jgi:hypothetical protein
MFVLKSSIKKLLEEAEQKGYERGCLDGYKRCEIDTQKSLEKARKFGFEQGLAQNPFLKK